MPRNDYEYYDEWLARDDEDYSISLDEWEDMCHMQDYGDDYNIDDDDDSFDW